MSYPWNTHHALRSSYSHRSPHPSIIPHISCHPKYTHFQRSVRPNRIFPRPPPSRGGLQQYVTYSKYAGEGQLESSCVGLHPSVARETEGIFPRGKKINWNRSSSQSDKWAHEVGNRNIKHPAKTPVFGPLIPLCRLPSLITMLRWLRSRLMDAKYLFPLKISFMVLRVGKKRRVRKLQVRSILNYVYFICGYYFIFETESLVCSWSYYSKITHKIYKIT